MFTFIRDFYEFVKFRKFMNNIHYGEKFSYGVEAVYILYKELEHNNDLYNPVKSVNMTFNEAFKVRKDKEDSKKLHITRNKAHVEIEEV